MLVRIWFIDRHGYVEERAQWLPALSGFEDEQPIFWDDVFYFFDMVIENPDGMIFVFQSVLKDILPEGAFHRGQELVQDGEHSRYPHDERPPCLVESGHDASVPAIGIANGENNFSLRVYFHQVSVVCGSGPIQDRLIALED